MQHFSFHQDIVFRIKTELIILITRNQVMKNSIILCFTILLLGISCSKEHDMTHIEEEPFTPITKLEIESLIISVGEDIPFSCTIDNQTYTSLGGGTLLLKNISLERQGNSVLVQSDGYFDEIRYVIPRLGAHMHLEVALSRLKLNAGYCRELDGFNAKEGGRISGFSIDIDIEPNVIVDESGEIFEGEVNVFACNVFDGAYVSNIRRFPHNQYVENGVSKNQNIGGGLNIVLLDNSDNRLYLKKGMTANLQFKVQSAEQLGIPDKMDMMYYDFDNDDWKDMGTVEKEGEYWSGTVNNLGLIVWGTTYETRVAKIKLMTDEGVVVPNKYVWLFTELSTPHSLAFSDDEGYIKINVPIGAEFWMRTLELNGANVVKSQEYEIVGNGQEDIIELEDFVLNSEFYQIYNGNVIDCDDKVVSNSAIIMEGFSVSFNKPSFLNYIFSNDVGEFNFAQTKTNVNPFKMKAFNFETDQISPENNVFNFEENIVDFGSLLLCE